jgi:hypothetical protein
VAHGLTEATTDLETIERWWWRWPTANIGGGVPAAYLLVDLDPRHGSAETLRSLDLPETLTVRTGGGGEHRFYAHPGGRLVQGANVLGPGVDTRMPGRGYTVLPPSRHASGRFYEWVDLDQPAVALPAAVLARLRPPPPVPRWQRGRKPTSDRRLEALAEVVATAAAGTRNDRCNWAGWRAREVVEAGAEPGHVLAVLVAAAPVGDGFSEAEATRAIASGLGVRP